MIIWLTGQPGAGKTTICKHAINEGAFHIDGDDLRDLFDNKDYSEAGRRKNVELAQQIAQYLHNKGKHVWVSLVSPFKDQRDKFKQKMGEDLAEVYVHTSEIRGREDFFVKEYGVPDNDYLDLDTTNITIEECVDKVIKYAILKK